MSQFVKPTAMPIRQNECLGAKRLTVCLVGPATETDFEDPQFVELVRKQVSRYAPVGILSLAAVLEQRGSTPDIVDLNNLHRDYLLSDEFRTKKIDFCEFAVRAFEQLSFDVFGFSTVCGSYPLTLRIAREVKRAHPNSILILGGPQATVVDVQTLNVFPFVDCIVRGEGEETFPLLLDALRDGASPEQIPGLTFRINSKIVRTPNASVIEDLDQLPLPAFHLYPDLKGYRLSLELGRGCPFACTFCSTNDFFRRNFRLKSPERLLAQMRQLRDTYWITTFDLIHDMFTVDRKRVVKFCNALLDSGEGFKWSCSARTDCIDDELIDVMYDAGCRGIFFGIETGSARLQKIVKKNLDLREASHRIEHCDKRKIRTTASLITGFPEETMEDVRDTVGFLVDSLRFDYVAPQLHLLSALSGTPLETKYRDQLVFDDIVSDMSYQGWQQDHADKELIQQHREVFANFYGVPAPALDRLYMKELRDFLLNGIERFHWLLVALHQVRGHIVDVFDEFRAWRLDLKRAALDREASTRYYANIDYVRDFLEFTRIRYADQKRKGGRTIATILEYENTLQAKQEEPFGRSNGDAAALRGAPASLHLAEIPCVAVGTQIAALSSDYKAVIRSLRRKGKLDRVPARPTVVVSRKGAEGRFEIVQLSPLSAALMRLCDGARTVRDISQEFAANEENGVDGIPTEVVCLFGLQLLRQQGLVVTSALEASRQTN